MFWINIIKQFEIKNKITTGNLKKNISNNVDTKIKTILTKVVEYSFSSVSFIFEKFFKNKKYISKFANLKIKYKTILINKINNVNLGYNKIQLMLISTIFKKKQAHMNLSVDNKNIMYSSNGIVLKKNNILEKSRKKDSKTTVTHINDSIVSIKKQIGYKKFLILISLKKVKPFTNKIIKIFQNELKIYKTTIVFTPSISFSQHKFKKIKSIKRRLRKKYKILDV